MMAGRLASMDARLRARLPSARRRAWSGVRARLRPAAAIAIAGGTWLALRATGTLVQIAGPLQVMGFDPDRARLLTSFTVEAVAIAIAVLATRAAVVASIAGVAIGAATVARTLEHE